MLHGDPLHVAAASDELVEFWTEHRDDERPLKRTFRVFGTGEPLPVAATYWGTTLRTPGLLLVWHLYETAYHLYEEPPA